MLLHLRQPVQVDSDDFPNTLVIRASIDFLMSYRALRTAVTSLCVDPREVLLLVRPSPGTSHTTLRFDHSEHSFELIMQYKTDKTWSISVTSMTKGVLFEATLADFDPGAVPPKFANVAPLNWYERLGQVD